MRDHGPAGKFGLGETRDDLPKFGAALNSDNLEPERPYGEREGFSGESFIENSTLTRSVARSARRSSGRGAEGSH